MMRIIVILALAVIAYLLLKRFLAGAFPSSMHRKGPGPPITDELVKDPVCGVYVPKKEALVYSRGGKLYYFCCEECLKKFKEGK